MKIVDKIPSRRFDGVTAGTISEGNGISVRMSADLSLDRDSDGSWLAYVSWGGGHEDASKSLTIHDPQVCAAFDALFELIADPVEFEGATFGERDAKEVA